MVSVPVPTTLDYLLQLSKNKQAKKKWENRGWGGWTGLYQNPGACHAKDATSSKKYATARNAERVRIGELYTLIGRCFLIIV